MPTENCVLSALPNRLSIGVMIATMGHESTKNSSSRNRVTIIRVVARPKLMPCIFMNTMATLLPPTALGVRAEVNSHIRHTRRARRQERSESVMAR